MEKTFCITVLLPQIYVARLDAEEPLQKLLELICKNKQLDPNNYEFRHPVDNSIVFSCDLNLGSIGLTQMRLCNKSEHYSTLQSNETTLELQPTWVINSRISINRSVEQQTKLSLTPVAPIRRKHKVLKSKDINIPKDRNETIQILTSNNFNDDLKTIQENEQNTQLDNIYKNRNAITSKNDSKSNAEIITTGKMFSTCMEKSLFEPFPHKNKNKIKKLAPAPPMSKLKCNDTAVLSPSSANTLECTKSLNEFNTQQMEATYLETNCNDLPTVMVENCYSEEFIKSACETVSEHQNRTYSLPNLAEPDESKNSTATFTITEKNVEATFLAEPNKSTENNIKIETNFNSLEQNAKRSNNFLEESEELTDHSTNLERALTAKFSETEMKSEKAMSNEESHNESIDHHSLRFVRQNATTINTPQSIEDENIEQNSRNTTSDHLEQHDFTSNQYLNKSQQLTYLKRSRTSTDLRQHRPSCDLSFGDSSSLQSLILMKSILNAKRNNSNNNETFSNAYNSLSSEDIQFNYSEESLTQTTLLKNSKSITPTIRHNFCKEQSSNIYRPNVNFTISCDSSLVQDSLDNAYDERTSVIASNALTINGSTKNDLYKSKKKKIALFKICKCFSCIKPKKAKNVRKSEDRTTSPFKPFSPSTLSSTTAEIIYLSTLNKGNTTKFSV